MILPLAQDQNREVRAEGKRGHENVYADTHSKEHSRPRYLLDLQRKKVTTFHFALFFPETLFLT